MHFFAGTAKRAKLHFDGSYLSFKSMRCFKYTYIFNLIKCIIRYVVYAKKIDFYIEIIVNWLIFIFLNIVWNLRGEFLRIFFIAIIYILGFFSNKNNFIHNFTYKFFFDPTFNDKEAMQRNNLIRWCVS